MLAIVSEQAGVMHVRSNFLSVPVDGHDDAAFISRTHTFHYQLFPRLAPRKAREKQPLESSTLKVLS